MAIDLFQADELVTRANVNQRITDIKNCFSGASLYSNSSGSAGTINLSDDYSNYDYIYVEYSDSYGTRNSVVFSASASQTTLTMAGADSSSASKIYFRTAYMTFSGTTATVDRNGMAQLNFSGNDSWYTDSNSLIYVTKIIGYKY